MVNRPAFLIIYGPGEGTVINMTKDEIIFGRDASADHAFPSDRISRQHARVYLEDGKWMLQDLNSKNHTLLDKTQVTKDNPRPLKDGSEIQLAARVVLKFKDPEATLSDTSLVIANGLWLDRKKGDVYIRSDRLTPKLSRQSYNILALLYDKSLQASPVASLQEICAAGWPGEHIFNPTMVNSELYRLRQRLKELEPVHEFICSERGRGWYFVNLGDS